MIRRDFLRRTLEITTGMVVAQKTIAAPCPPLLFSDSGTQNPPSCDVSSLASVADALGAGQSSAFTANTLQHPQDIQWQTQTIFYDESRRELQYMGKPATSQSSNYSHYIYSADNNTWRTSGKSLFPGTGHIWNMTFDLENGDYWFRKYNENRLRYFDRSSNAWKTTGDQNSPGLNDGNTNLAAMGWHPNLFGAGQSGIFLWSPYRFFAYNINTQKFTVLSPNNFSSSSPFWNRGPGQALYLPGSDQLICFAQRANGHQAILVNAGAGNASDALGEGKIQLTGEPPIQVYGGGGTSNHGHVVNHPNNPNRLLLLDEHGSSRVWESNNAGQSWSQKGYRHPFQEMRNASAGEYTVGTIAPHGVIVGMTSDYDGGELILWKPGD
jgi:hypothetical protein